VKVSEMIPKRKQWKNWSLPSKYAAVGLCISLIALIITIIFQVIFPPATKHQVKEVDEKVSSVSKQFSSFSKQLSSFSKQIETLKWEIIAQNLSENEVENQLDKEFRKVFLKEKKEALRLYNAGVVAYDHNHFKNALSYFSKALQVVEISAFHFSKFS